MSMAPKDIVFKFPKGFYFGAATSAHQVEGGNYNDWTEWERQNAKLQMLNAKLREWPEYILKNYPNPPQEENYISGASCDHYNRFREDFDIAKSLGHNAHRFSIEWSRIEPEEGKFDQKEIEHYREVIMALRARGIEPFVTLWHWTLPIWARDLGGWNSPKIIFYFKRFCELVAREFGKDVRFWIVLNEPEVYMGLGYMRGAQPPGKRNIIKGLLAYYFFIRAQKEIYAALKKIDSSFQVGIAESMEWREFPLLRKIVHYFRNFFFLRCVKNSLDFIGINYYRRTRFFKKPEGNISDLGWEIYPEGLYKFIKETWLRFRRPIFVTENGIADARDEKRTEFIREHLQYISKAIKEGIDVRGYFHWSLLDNFEIPRVDGFWPRFGLVEIDYKTQERKIRPSALEYKKIIDEFSVG